MISARLILPMILLAASPIPTPTTEEADLTRLVDSFVAAQTTFDQATLARLTAPDYVEISPLGEVDPRERMLSFYAPDKKQPAPPATISERGIRHHGDMAVITARISYGPAALRAVYVAHRLPTGWVLMSAQFTPIRASRPS